MPRSIYQLVNFSAEEVYVGMTGETAEKKLESLTADPPPSLKHWGFGADQIKMSVVDSFENDEDAATFFKGFWHSLSHSSWRTIHCDEDCIDTDDHGPCGLDCDARRKDKQG